MPLLFVQLAYYSVFYPATILMAWFWLAIIGLLIPAYYGVYAYAGGLRKASKRAKVAAMAAMRLREIRRGKMRGRWRRRDRRSRAARASPAGELSPAGARPCSLSRSLSVCQRLEPDGARRPVAGALAAAQYGRRGAGHRLEHGRPDALAPLAVDVRPGAGHDGRLGRFRRRVVRPQDGRRRLPPLGLAICAVAVHDEHRSGLRAAGSWYVFGTWSKELRAEMFSGPLLPLTLATAAAPGLPWLLLIAVVAWLLAPDTAAAGLRPHCWPCAISACWASTPSAGRSCRMSI